jgi:small subunit ribosomal protein S8
MAVSDPVADFLTAVRNAVRAKHRKVDVNASQLKTEIAKVLLRERFINNFKVIEDSKQGVLRIYLKYSGEDVNVITGIRRTSTPGRRVYVGKERIPRVMGGLGTSILSTSAADDRP